MSYKVIRLPEVIDMTGLSRSTIYLRMSKGTFPRSISLGQRAVGWLKADIEKWLDACVSASKAVDND
ncbi:helix-turn-helix transcriptional regulator [Vibrio caribbeanicus]|uniref:Phage transcriptional regulator AlpA n=1 Tax=Vibrio caribbeanicus ATCC BAA-2122 TaxID=796620 RepID=E3BPZ3_9VIBR|nr:AlpA family transcriptional regulator [Vibrio caribbeanicus]EFP94918.1 phage transcriptional regulator AlpA [Vibrio caribbeanicus ATCC BAA-2122]